MLTSRIHLPPAQDAEDIFSSSLSVIFPDDTCIQHGDVGVPVIYRSVALGDITLAIANPKGEVERRLFANSLWNAAVQLSVLLEEDAGDGGVSITKSKDESQDRKHSWQQLEGSRGEYDVKGLKILELGAGTGLAGIVAALMGASECIISDYPASEVLSNLQSNVERNIGTRRSGGQAVGAVSVQAHEWGDCGSSFALHEQGKFDRLLIADCLWMPWQHDNLRRSIAWFLKLTGKAWVVAGFHTGREKVKSFFDEKELRRLSLKVNNIMERDVDGKTRQWCQDRGKEDATERKRWLVIATLEKIEGSED